MKRLISAALFLLLVVISAAALAEFRTVTLSVSGMTWGACVTSVKRSLTKVNGVTKAEVSLEKAQAVVTFDDAKTSTDALLKATKDAGYPSTLK